MPADLDRTFEALADPARRRMIKLLRGAPRSSGDIALRLKLSRPTASRHLGVLRRAGLVEEAIDEEDARVRIYRLRRKPFTQLRGWLDEVESFWEEQLDAFKRYAEGKQGP